MSQNQKIHIYNGEDGGEGRVENVVRKIMGIMMRMKGGGDDGEEDGWEVDVDGKVE